MNIKTTVILLVSIFFSITIFGAFIMSGMGHSMELCPFSVLNPIDCPSTNEISIALHHISSLDNFSTAIFSINIMFLLVLSTFFAVKIFIYKNLILKSKIKNLNITLCNYLKLNEEIYLNIVNLLFWIKNIQTSRPAYALLRRVSIYPFGI
ncbi:MAG: hypothetical protein R3251_01520 [Candidatus Spechtbacterales bacterium]|nr:hypothetical protein [Candidatus Spechtbacterales bacterium]